MTNLHKDERVPTQIDRSHTFRSLMYPPAAAILSAKSTRWWVGIILIAYVIGFFSQWTRNADGFAPTFANTTAFGLDSASVFYGFIALLAATGNFRTHSIALTLGRRPHRGTQLIREVIGITAVVLALHVVLSLVFTACSAVLFTLGSKPTPTAGDFGSVAASLLMQWGVGLFVCVISALVGFAFRSAAIALVAYLLILLIAPVAGAGLMLYNETLGKVVLNYSLPSVINSITQQNASIGLSVVVAAVAWVLVPAILALFSFRRYTP